MHSISLLLHLLIPPGVAAALPEIAVVGVHVPGLSLEDAEAQSQAIAEALAGSGALAVIDPVDFAARIQGRESLIIQEAALHRGLEALSDGRALFERADTEGAVPLLERAVSRLEEGTRAVGDPQELVEARLLLGLAQASLGDSEAALDSWREVAVLAPSLELDPIRYAPKIVSLFEEARGLAAATLAGPLTVSGAAGSGEVLIDGRPAGPSPALIDGLPAGTHYVLLETEGGARQMAVAELSEGAPTELVVSEQSASLGRPAETPVGRALQTGELYRALGEYGDTALFLVGGVVAVEGAEQVSLSLYAPRTRTFSKPLSADAGEDPVGAMMDLLPSLTTYLTDAGSIRADRVSPQVSPLDISSNPVLTALLFDPASAPASAAPADDARSGRWVLWAGAGALAAGGATAAAIWLLSDGSSTAPDPTGTIIVGPIP